MKGVLNMQNNYNWYEDGDSLFDYCETLKNNKEFANKTLDRFISNSNKQKEKNDNN